jgi:uncharacterized membrane protein YhaH (DUF805 family)
MAYDPGAQNAALLLRTLRGIVTFSGRSRRTEVVYYWIAAILADTVLAFALAMILPVPAASLAATGLRWIIYIPLIALFTRRLHDHGRSGWWTLLLVAELGWQFLATAPAQNFLPISLMAAMLLSLALLALWFWPGTDGANIYGPDPREGDSAG